MQIVIYGSSILSSYWNGAATYYRGIVRALVQFGYAVTFLEPDFLERQKHRDIEPPSWCNVIVYPATAAGLRFALEHAAVADIVVKASGVGVYDAELLEGILTFSRPNALRIFWDVDAPATLAEIASAPDHGVRVALPKLDVVLSYGGGDAVVRAYRDLSASMCVPIYNALDQDTHHPVACEDRYRAHLTFVGNRLPDRERRVEQFFIAAAASRQERHFLLGGSGWDDKICPVNITKLGHVSTRLHNVVNSSALAVLNVSRDRMAATGFSPATRVFEAAGAGACLITDAWEGISNFLLPGKEVFVVRDGADVVEVLDSLTPDRAAAVGAAALARVCAEHTYAHRAALLSDVLVNLLTQRRAG